MNALILSVPLAPLLGAIVAGLFSRLAARGDVRREKVIAHCAAIGGTAWAFAAAAAVAFIVVGGEPINFDWFVWARAGEAQFSIGFLIDNLSALMMLVVTFVSLMVHVYTVGYMKDDPGYARFFAYIALFTFAMLMLVMANNFLQLFFGWEAVGLASYLLIGFWHTRPSAIYANLKAFLVNRVGDFGFLIGVGLIFAHFGSLDYARVFAGAPAAAADGEIAGVAWPLVTTICIALFVGAMGKSAQFPLHVWLPDSMEGPTPISALIHAATMVTAGIFMVARMSPLFELSQTALSLVLAAGTVTAFFMAWLALVQNDIKRVVAYSTLSQLGYMTAALGASAYSAAMFHLTTHAFFKALLFLGAGSVIIALHHEQDMRKMGGLRKVMPITYLTAIIGSLALAGLPPFAGFFSKDAIIEAVKHADAPGAALSYYALSIGAFLTALYSFRLIFLVFHGESRSDAAWNAAESPKVVTAPLILLAIPAALAGLPLAAPLLFGDFFGGAIVGGEEALAPLAQTADSSAIGMLLHGAAAPALWLAIGGVLLAAVCYLWRPQLPGRIAASCGMLYKILLHKYGMDDFNDWFFARGARALAAALWRGVDAAVIDNFFVGGAARIFQAGARAARRLQTGYIYHYAFAMIISVAAILLWWLVQ